MVDEIHDLFDMGLLTDSERSKLVVAEWAKAKDEIQEGLRRNRRRTTTSS
ncbi:MAG: hypothetical protein MZU97_20785 [Bacillus subtilis]|nr:hypothetical protein [Bacillus subtilis]